MFDIDTFLSDIIEAGSGPDPRMAVKEILTRTIDDHDAVAAALAPDKGGLTQLYNSPQVTVMHFVWTPKMQVPPHDHRMWAAIGIYTGREENTFFRRRDEDRALVEPLRGRTLDEGDVVMLGDDVIHAVTNPLPRFTGALHVYGGDFANEPRSQFDPRERPYDVAYFRSLFEADAVASDL